MHHDRCAFPGGGGLQAASESPVDACYSLTSQRHEAGLAAAVHQQHRVLPVGLGVAEHPAKCRGGADGLAADFLDDVARLNPGIVGRAALLDLGDDHARTRTLAPVLSSSLSSRTLMPAMLSLGRRLSAVRLRFAPASARCARSA